jgi:hypothetical protein
LGLRSTAPVGETDRGNRSDLTRAMRQNTALG